MNKIVPAFLILTFYYGRTKRRNKYEVYHISVFKTMRKTILTVNTLREIKAMGLCEKNYSI